MSWGKLTKSVLPRLRKTVVAVVEVEELLLPLVYQMTTYKKELATKSICPHVAEAVLVAAEVLMLTVALVKLHLLTQLAVVRLASVPVHRSIWAERMALVCEPDPSDIKLETVHVPEGMEHPEGIDPTSLFQPAVTGELLSAALLVLAVPAFI